jgi:hypothetical protein
LSLVPLYDQFVQLVSVPGFHAVDNTRKRIGLAASAPWPEINESASLTLESVPSKRTQCMRRSHVLWAIRH